MTGMHSTTFSPDNRNTRRKTPCVEGCCGPMFRINSSVSRPSSSMTGSSTPAPSRICRNSVSVVLSVLPALRDLLAQPQDAFEQGFGTRWTAGHIHVDGDDRVDTLERRVAVPELAT